MKQELETYIAKVYCDNCGTEIDLEIPKGITINDFTAKEICRHCGCAIKPSWSNNWFWCKDTSGAVTTSTYNII